MTDKRDLPAVQGAAGLPAVAKAQLPARSDRGGPPAVRRVQSKARREEPVEIKVEVHQPIARHDQARTTAVQRGGSPPAPRPRPSSAPTTTGIEQHQQKLFLQMYGRSATDIMEHMQGTFLHIGKMGKEEICAAARTIRVMAEEADMEDDGSVYELLEAIRVRMFFLWRERYPAYVPPGEQLNKVYERNEYISALGHDIRIQIPEPIKKLRAPEVVRQTAPAPAPVAVARPTIPAPVEQAAPMVQSTQEFRIGKTTALVLLSTLVLGLVGPILGGALGAFLAGLLGAGIGAAVGLFTGLLIGFSLGMITILQKIVSS